MELLAVLLGLGALLLVVVALVGAYVSRRVTLSRRVGSFSCAVAPAGGSPTGWVNGVAQYATGRLVWWRNFSLAPRPVRSWSRAGLSVVERVPLQETDAYGRPLVRVTCRHEEEAFQMLLSAPALAGLVSWLESSPSVPERSGW